MNSKIPILLLPIVSLFWLVGTVFIGGLNYPDYSHVTQFMSELGASGSEHGGLVNFFGFVPTELFLLVFIGMAFLLLKKNTLAVFGLSSLSVYATALMLAAVFPCDFECRPVNPTLSHKVHMILGAIAYAFAILGIVLMSFGLKNLPNGKPVYTSGLGIGIIALFLYFNMTPELPIVGLVQRLMEILFYFWFFILAIYLYRHQ